MLFHIKKEKKRKIASGTFSNFVHIGRTKTTHHKINMKIFSDRTKLVLFETVFI